MKYVVAALIAGLFLLPVLLMGPRMAVIFVPIALVAAWVHLSDQVGRHSQRRTGRA